MIKKTMEKHGVKITSVVITTLILGLLIIGGPAKAFTLGFGIDGSSNGEYTAVRGEDVKFIVSVDIEDRDSNLPIKELNLILDAREDFLYRFDVNGNFLEDYEGISIRRITNDPNYGYGYGYGYHNGYGYDFDYGYGYNDYGYGYGDSDLIYEVTLDTSSLRTDEYDTILQVLIGSKWFGKTGDKLIIQAPEGNTGDSDGDWDEDEESDSYVYDPEDYSNSDDDTIINKTVNGAKNIFSRITGAVVGVLGTTATVVMSVFLAGLGILAITLRVIRKRKGL